MECETESTSLRERLENMTVEQLKKEAKKFQLSGSGRKGSIIDLIMDHIDKNPHLVEQTERSAVEEQIEQPLLNKESQAVMTEAQVANVVQKAMQAVSEQMQRQQQMMMDQFQLALQQIIHRDREEMPLQTSMERPSGERLSGFSPVRETASAEGGTQSSGDRRERASHSTVGSLPPANAVSLLGQQIPEFSGGEEENIDVWIQRVDRVAQIHRVSEDITLLAASSKLIKEAKKWYNFQSGASLESWSELRAALRRTFEQKVPFYIQIQKVENRKWIYMKETFQHYAIEKLSLMHSLNLPTKDVINLLIGGITSASLRATASTLTTNSVEEFLEKMRQLTAAAGDMQRKATSGGSKGNKSSDFTCKTCGKKGHATKDCRGKDYTLTCFFCKAEGHRRTECPKLQRKDVAKKEAQPTSEVSAVKATEDASQVVASVRELEKKLTISNTFIKIVKLNNKECNILVLIDTGSPVSFIREDIFQEFFTLKDDFSNSAIRKFTALNNLPIQTCGSVRTQICFEQCPNSSFNVELQILKGRNCSNTVIIGRDFLINEEITVVYKPFKSLSDQIQLLPNFDICEVTDKLENKINDLHIDFEESVKTRLKEMLLNIENAERQIIDDDYSVRINLKDKSTYAYSPRRFALEQRKQIREIVDDLLERKIIQHSTSPYCARVVPVQKRNGKVRLCVDLRPLNSRVSKQKYPFPLIEDCLLRISNKSVFTVLDMKDGFHQIKVHPEDSKYFAFATPDGQYEYTRLPFGYSESPAEFQKRLVNILQPLIRKDKVVVYIDDIMIASCTVEENLETLRDTLNILKSHSFELNYDKCQFLKKEVQYLGYIISDQGITLSPHHTEAIEKFPLPKNVLEVKRFLGLTGYFRKFIRDYAEKARPLSNLLKKSSMFNFDDDCSKAFNLLKKELIAYPVLRIYNPEAETELHTDASAQGIAAILLQKQSSGSWTPVAYFSQSTNIAESKYHSFELEMLAIVRAVERFHIYLYGLQFTVVTDCNALVFAVNKANLNPRIARWTLALQNYSFKVAHRPGKRMAHVDALSRQISLVNALPLENELQYRQLKDSRIIEIAKQLENSENDKFEIIDGLIYKKGDRSRFYVPELMVNNVIKMYHDEMGHCGLEKTVNGIRETYWFPSMRKRVRVYIENCITCLMSNTSSHMREGEMQICGKTNLPFEIIHVDHFGPLPDTDDGHKYILVAIDAFTRYTWLFPVRSTTTKETCDKLKLLFNIFGTPKEIVSDRGSAFTAKDFAHFVESYNIKHRQVAVAAPWANGLVERVNRFLKSTMTKMIDNLKEWKVLTEQVQYVINNTYHSSINSTPSKLLLGYDQRNHSDAILKDLIDRLASVERDIESERQMVRDKAIEATEKIRNYNKIYYDSAHKKPTVYKEGDFVLIRDLQAKAGQSKKFKVNYKGPYLITKVLDKNRYVVRDVPGFNLSNKPYNTIHSPDKIKPWQNIENN